MVTWVNRSSSRLRSEVVRAAIELLLAQHGRAGGHVTVALVEGAEMRELNRMHRQVDAETDVLSFPAPEIPGMENELGDVAVSVDFARRQARMRGVRMVDEAALLALHGTLHLLGFDDETDAGRDEMVALMNRAADAAGVPTDAGWCSLPHGEGVGAG